MVRVDSPEFDRIANEILAEIIRLHPLISRYCCAFCGQKFFDRCPSRCLGPRPPGEPVVCINSTHSHYGCWVWDYPGREEGDVDFVKDKAACLQRS